MRLLKVSLSVVQIEPNGLDHMCRAPALASRCHPPGSRYGSPEPQHLSPLWGNEVSTRALEHSRCPDSECEVPSKLLECRKVGNDCKIDFSK